MIATKRRDKFTRRHFVCEQCGRNSKRHGIENVICEHCGFPETTPHEDGIHFAKWRKKARG